VFTLLPLLTSLENNKFVNIETGNSILHIEQSRQYYFTTNQDELVHCKTLELQFFVCKQRRPLLSSHMQEMCPVKMLQPRFSIRKGRDKRTVSITHSVWTHSAFVYIIVVVIALYRFFKLYKITVYHLKRNKNFRAIAASATDHTGLPTDAGGSGNVLNIYIKTSNESLAMTPEAITL
jgi:hypothetical protein